MRQPLFSICFSSRRDFPRLYLFVPGASRRDVTLPEMEFIFTFACCCPPSPTHSPPFLFPPPPDSLWCRRHSRTPCAALPPPVPLSSAAWQILLLPFALSVWSPPANQCLQPLEWPYFMFCKLIGRQCSGILFLDPARTQTAKGFRSNIAIWPSGISPQWSWQLACRVGERTISHRHSNS